MPRSEITLGFVGAGAVEKKNATTLLRDWIDGNGGTVKALLPMTKDHWNPSLAVVAEFLVSADVPIEAIVDDTTAKVRELKPYLTVARKQHQSTAVPHKMATLLSDAHDARLVVLWDDEDDNVHDTVREVDQAGGIVLLDLTDGLDPIDLQTEEPEEDEEFEEPESDELPDADDESEEDETGEGEDDEEEFEDEDAGDGEELADGVEGEEDADAEAEDDLDENDEADDEGFDLPDDDDEELELPEEDEENVLTALLETDQGPMTEFQGKLINLLERVVTLLEQEMSQPLTEKVAPRPPAKVATGTESKAAAKKAVAPKAAPAKPAAKAPAKKVAPPVKRTVKPAAKEVPAPPKKAPAKKAAPVKRAVKAASSSSNGKMTKAAAQKILDEYRPRRGRPPAEVTEAKQVLGLI